jgi:hypothetical protein
VLAYDLVFDAERMHRLERERPAGRWDAEEVADVSAFATDPCHHPLLLSDDVDQGPGRWPSDSQIYRDSAPRLCPTSAAPESPKAFGSKAALAKRVYDVTLVGDEEPVPLAERAEIQAIIAEPNPRQKLAMYAALGRKLVERIGPLLSVLFSGAKAGDPELAEFAATTARERLIGVSGLVGQLDAVGALRPGLGVDRARDIVWTLIAWEVYELLVIGRGWSLDDWEAWVAESTAALLLRDAGAGV